jgi:hypothetical protein
MADKFVCIVIIRRFARKFNGQTRLQCGKSNTPEPSALPSPDQSAILSAMNLKAARCPVLVAAVLVTAPFFVLADDSAASIAAGGLVPRRETRIVMAKEVLRISDKKVVVDYDFRNDTDQDVTTEVAFPIPPYTNGIVEGPSPDEQSFKSFKLWVDGKTAPYESDATATLNDKDVTVVLKQNKIDIPTFGHFEVKEDSKGNGVIDTPDFSRLPKAAKGQLVKAGIFKLLDQDPWSQWTVHLQYHWAQSFPAHSTVHIRHEYSPFAGFQALSLDTIRLALKPPEKRRTLKLDPDALTAGDRLMEFCPKPDFLHGMEQGILGADPNDGQYAYPVWVDFILTSANTWQEPIEDFTLQVERGKSGQGGKRLVSFCSPANGKLEKLDADHFQVHLTNFVPTAELHIGFFDLPLAKPAPKQ